MDVGIDTDCLDKHLNIGAAYPDLPQRLERWRADSAAVREQIEGRLDLPYGPGPRERLDYFPSSQAGANIVFIHGGSWRVLEKDTFSFIAAPLVRAGFNVAVINYPLAPSATLSEIVDSVRRAMLWLVSSPEGPRLASGRTAVVGHSAGGHLAAMLALTDWSMFGLTSAPFAAGCSIGGLYDIETVRHSFLNADLRLDSEGAALVSPLEHLRRIDIPYLLAIAEHESPEFQRQHREFAVRWREQGQAVDAVQLDGHDHFSVLGAPLSAGGAVIARISSMVSA